MITISDFLQEFQDVLQRDEAITVEDTLADMEEWDSMSFMASMVWLEKRFGVKYSITEIAQLQTVAEMISLTKGAVA